MRPIACVILPTYNESENIEAVIRGIFEQREKIKTHELYVLVVDDNSPDGTEKIVSFLQNKYYNLYIISEEKQGLGDAYKKGIEYALKRFEPDLIIQMDADGQHDPDSIPVFISLINNGFSLVVGSRFAQGGGTPYFSIIQKIYSLFGNWLIRLFGGIPRIRDCTSGFKCIKADLIKKCSFDFISTNGYSFQSSFLFELIKNGAEVIEVPIIFSNRLAGETKLSAKDRLNFLLNLIKLRFSHSEELIKFCFVGASGIIVNLGVYITLTRLFYVILEIASPIGIECSIITNFFLNNAWTFKKRKNRSHIIKKMLKFHIVAGIAGIINYSIVLSLVYIFGLYDLIAICIGIIIATLINYGLNSMWTWKHKHEEETISDTEL
ncbi:MAG: glycosyltransferase family 2 protein [Victivallales bacterium]|nr:glycosyltransferase family 2 protein [Victivallales bacterium]